MHSPPTTVRACREQAQQFFENQLFSGGAQLVEDSNGNVKIVSSNAGKEFAAEEISAQVLRKLVDDASKFLNDKVPAPLQCVAGC